MPGNITTYPTGAFGQFVGIQNIVSITNPSAGADWAYVTPAGYFHRLIGGAARMTCSAVVANRFFGLTVSYGGSVIARSISSIATAASTVASLGYGAQNLFASGAGGAAGQVISLGNLWIPPQYTLGSQTVNIDVSDQYSQIFLWFEQLDFGPQGMPMLSHPATHEELHEIQPALIDK